MPSQTYNTASLSFECGSQKGFVSSNVAVTTMQEVITVSISSLGNSYSKNSDIPFVITINNNSFDEIKDISIQNDLGSYHLGQEIYDANFTPLTYIGPSFFYIDGKFSSKIIPEVSQGKIIYKIKSMKPKSNVLIFYKTSINEFSPLKSGSKIKNTATISTIETKNSIKASCFLTVKDSADIKIIKNMNPNQIVAGEKITYNFSLYNYGNTAATNVVLNDIFSPFPSNLNVFIDSKELKNSDFSYVNGSLTIPSNNSKISISIPPANFIQDVITGLISIDPGMITIKALGQI